MGFVHTIVELQPERMCGLLDLVNLVQSVRSIVGHSFNQVQKDCDTPWISVDGRKPEPLLGPVFHIPTHQERRSPSPAARPYPNL